MQFRMLRLLLLRSWRPNNATRDCALRRARFSIDPTYHADAAGSVAPTRACTGGDVSDVIPIA